MRFLTGIFGFVVWVGAMVAPLAGASEWPPCALVTLEVMPKGATTLLDGQSLDQNVWLISVLPGTHTLEVRKAGFRTYAKDLELTPGARLRLTVQLERIP